MGRSIRVEEARGNAGGKGGNQRNQGGQGGNQAQGNANI